MPSVVLDSFEEYERDDGAATGEHPVRELCRGSSPLPLPTSQYPQHPPVGFGGPLGGSTATKQPPATTPPAAVPIRPPQPVQPLSRPPSPTRTPPPPLPADDIRHLNMSESVPFCFRGLSVSLPPRPAGQPSDPFFSGWTSIPPPPPRRRGRVACRGSGDDRYVREMGCWSGLCPLSRQAPPPWSIPEYCPTLRPPPGFGYPDAAAPAVPRHPPSPVIALPAAHWNAQTTPTIATIAPNNAKSMASNAITGSLRPAHRFRR